jgi:hypothetical protein
LLVSTSAAATAATTAAATATTTAAATAASAAATAAITTASAATAASIGLGAGLINIYSSTQQILTIHFFDSLFCFLLGRHFYKSKTSGFPAESVFDNIDRFNLTKGLENLAQVVFGCIVRQISYIDIHFFSSFKY